jgi:hypothetical protein
LSYKLWIITDNLIVFIISGQIEHRQKDGTKEMTYPNGTKRTSFPNGHEEWVFQDGLVVKVDSQLGEKILLLPNGQKEVQTKEHMVRLLWNLCYVFLLYARNHPYKFHT